VLRARLGVVLAIAGLLAATARAEDVSVLDDRPFVAALDRALDRMYDLDLEGAAGSFRELAAGRPGHPIGPLLEAEVLWWRIQLDPLSTAHDDRFLERIETAVRKAEARLKRDRRDVDARFALAAGYALRARLRSLRRDWITAAWDSKRALNQVLTLRELRPHDPDLNLGLGLYDHLADAAPERYPVLRALRPFFPDGDRERGLARLHRAKRSSKISRTEAAFFLLQIEYFFEARYLPALEEARWLRARHPDNSVFHLFEGRIYSRWRQCATADRIFREVLAKRRDGAFGYGDHQAEVAHFHRARCALLDGRPVDALRHADAAEALAERRHSTFHSSAHLHRGMAYDLQGERSRALVQYHRALVRRDMGTTHERARRFLEQPFEGGGEDGGEE